MNPIITLGCVAMVGCALAQQNPRRSESTGMRFPVPVISGKPAASLANPLDGTNLPLVAVWQDSSNRVPLTNSRSLRVAIWPDGRVVFARDPNSWGQDLLLGQLSNQALAELKTGIRETGVFKLPGHCYLVPDAPVDCLMISLGGSQQMLYWDEVEAENYGINIDPQPHHLAFKEAWWTINRLVLSALPDRAVPLGVPFKIPPQQWYVKKKIQSE